MKGISRYLGNKIFEILDLIHDFVLVVDSNGHLCYTNSAYERMLGLTRDYVRKNIWGKHLSTLIYDSELQDVILSGKRVIDLRRVIEKAGIEVKGSVLPIIEDGRFLGAIIVVSMTQVSELFESLIYSRSKYTKDQVKFKPKDLLPECFRKMVGNNISFVKTLVKANAAASTNSTVLIEGESGVGKELLARAIHEASNRKDGPFVAINCAAIPESLLESELFGYEPGAFTGASKKGKPGKFELATGGTLFLDEVGDLPLTMQAKLLRALQFQQIERVGGTRKIDVDVRVISSTNKKLEWLIPKGLFREDLYYRLNVIPITLPTLRERKDDLYLLAEHFLDSLCKEYGSPPMRFASDVITLFHAYDWPGNLRELSNVIEHAFVLARSDSSSLISSRHLPRAVLLNNKCPEKGEEDAGKSPSGDCIHVNIAGKFLKNIIEELETAIIKKAIKESGGNKSKVIKKLGLNRSTFYNKVKKYKIN